MTDRAAPAPAGRRRVTRPAFPRSPFWPPATIALVQIGAGMPSAGYAHYRARLDLSDGAVTALFAILVVHVMASLWASRAPGAVRRRGVLLVAALGAAAVADVVFVVAGSYAALAVASALQGVAVGLACGLAPAVTTSALGDADRASRWVTLANGVGMAAGPVLAGLANEFLPLPHALVFVAHGLACVAVAVPLAAARRAAPPSGPAAHGGGGRATGTRLRTTFATGYLAFCAGGLFVSLTAVLVADVIRLSSSVAPGALIAAFFTANALTGALLARRPGTANVAGTALFAAGLVVAAVALHRGDLASLAVAAVACGAGQGALVGGAVTVAGRADSAGGGNTATALFFFWGYCGAASAALAVGWVSGFVGPRPAFLVLLGLAVAGLVLVGFVDRARGRPHAG